MKSRGRSGPNKLLHWTGTCRCSEIHAVLSYVKAEEGKVRLTILLSKRKEWSSGKPLQQALGWMLAVLLLAGCGEAPAGQQGEIIGIAAKISLVDAQAGKTENIAYVGTIVVTLPEEGEVNAICDEEFLPEIKGAPAFSSDQLNVGVVLTIRVNLKKHQNVLLDRNESDEWEVTRVLE
jgi:hypothetical protein